MAGCGRYRRSTTTPAYAIKKADLDSFLSESSRPGFRYRLLIASTDHLGGTARRTLDGQEKPVGTLLRSDLVALDLAWPRSLASLRPAKLKPKKPRPHQRDAVSDILKGLATNERGQVVMACGTGKTLVARFLHDEMAAKRTLVLVPSLSLLKQSLREWLAVGTFDYLAVCSDETVAPDEADAIVSATSELGVPVTTDPMEITRFLRRRGGGVVFATYQSSPRIAAAQVARVPAFDLVVADEAHRCAGPEAGVFATVLDPKRIKGRKRVFMTATPRYFTGRLQREAKEADWEIASMDDERKFGPVLHRLSFAQAIEQDLLSDYQVVVVGVSDQTYREMAEGSAFVTTDGETITDARTLARQIGLLRAMRKHDLHRVVSFHSRISNATSFARDILKVSDWMPPRLRPKGHLWAQHVSGKMTSGERETRLNRLRAVTAGERGLLTNARCLSEGVDVPTLDGVAFIDPRRSQVDIVQAVGRAIRKAPDKMVGTIIIPVFVDDMSDPEQALESGEFDRVWQIVRALRDHDDVLADELDGLRRELGQRRRSGGRPEKIVFDLPVGIGDRFAHAFDSRLVERSTSRWEEGIGHAQAYREANGQLRVPNGYVAEDGFPLSSWLTTRRLDRRGGVLSAERIAQLDALGIIWEPLAEDWRQGIEGCRAYRATYGHLRVPLAFRSGDGFPLGQWLNYRRAIGRSRRGQLTGEQIAELDALGMVWHAYAEDWQRGIEACRAYKNANGHLRVPKAHVAADGFRLGGWLGNRRHARKTNRLSPDRIKELDALGMVWDAPDERWQRAIEACRLYLNANGHLRAPPKYVAEDGFRLGGWLDSRRQDQKMNRLSPERIAELDALGIIWEPFDMKWQRGIEACRLYVNANGHLRVPQRYMTEDGFALGTWVNWFRQDRRRGVLPQERLAELDALGMVWDPFAEDWRRGIEACLAYRNANGHLRVPPGHVTENGFRLGQAIT